MITRGKQAYNKFVFCLRVAGNAKSLLSLMINSKRFSRFQKNHSTPAEAEHAPLEYNFGIKKNRQNFFLRTYAGDIRMFYEIFLDEVYRLPPYMLPVNAVILDAGANIGLAAAYFSFCYPSARIFCVEPSKANYLLLTKNLQKQIGSDRVLPLQAALYSIDGLVRLDENGWAYNARLSEAGETMVDAITISTFMQLQQLERIDLLKMDIEGAESAIFSGDTSWLAQVNAVLIEIHGTELINKIQLIFQQAGFGWYQWPPGNKTQAIYLASKK